MHMLPSMIELNSGMLLLTFFLLGLVWLVCSGPNRSEANRLSGEAASLQERRIARR